MGLTSNSTKLLLYCKREDVNFEKTITLGRQCLHLSEGILQRNLTQYGFKSDAAKNLMKDNIFCESFFQLLGANLIDSIDASNYENATIIHDMNIPVSDKLKDKYTVVLDGGTLEHVFNFPIAIQNCMEMLKVQGYYIGITPTNNFVGHGFYQFSPELYFSIFSEENGFEIKKIFFYTDKSNAKFYEVSNPNLIRERVILSNRHPSYLFVLAQKIGKTNIFENTPQQSDYKNIIWKDIDINANERRRKDSAIKRLIPNTIKHFLKVKYHDLKLLKQIIYSDIGNADKNHFKQIKLM